MPETFDNDAYLEIYGFSNLIPIPGRLYTDSGSTYDVAIGETTQHLGLKDPKNGRQLNTRVWGYDAGEGVTYPGITFVADSQTDQNSGIEVNWINRLPGRHILNIDPSLHRSVPLPPGIDDPYKQVFDSFINNHIPTVTHLHGGETDADADGYPEAWFTKNNRYTGDYFSSDPYDYDNQQRGATLWYHDHALGITRLNVYAGLAGFYLLTDETEANLVNSGVIPGLTPESTEENRQVDSFGTPYDLEVVIQDRIFDDKGQLFYPTSNFDLVDAGIINAPEEGYPGVDVFTTAQIEDLLASGGSSDFTDEELTNLIGELNTGQVPELPASAIGSGETDHSALAEFFGNGILVNGMAWPSMKVEEKGKYRLQLLNGSDSRVYVLGFDDLTYADQIRAYQIGTDGGLLDQAYELDVNFNDGLDPSNALVIAPGDRADVVFDFSNFDIDDGADSIPLTLKNGGTLYEPFGGLDGGVDEGTLAAPVGNIMQFQISDLPQTSGSESNAETFSVEDGTELASSEEFNFPKELTENSTRRLGLFEGTDIFGRVQPELGTLEGQKGLTELSIDGTGLDSSNLADVDYGSQPWTDPTTEIVQQDTTERWEVYNFTADSHPIHTHLTQYQMVGFYSFESTDDMDGDGVPDDLNGVEGLQVGLVSNGDQLAQPGGDNTEKFEILVDDTGFSRTLTPNEEGWQDTAYVNPDELMVFDAYFEKAGLYVWHCHILSHEDHEMMRPMQVVDNTSWEALLDGGNNTPDDLGLFANTGFSNLSV